MTSFHQRIDDILETPLRHFSRETKLIHLGIDSAKMVEIGILIEETYDIPIKTDDMKKLTVGYILDLKD